MQDLCRCGCGGRTRIASRNRRDLGHVKGKPISFVNGHNRRGERCWGWTEEDRGYYTACWIWQGYVNENGYPSSGSGWAHRELYEMLSGSIPPGLELDHLCRVRCCVNPDHLEPVTHAENLRRGAGNGGVLCATT